MSAYWKVSLIDTCIDRSSDLNRCRNLCLTLLSELHISKRLIKNWQLWSDTDYPQSAQWEIRKIAYSISIPSAIYNFLLITWTLHLSSSLRTLHWRENSLWLLEVAIPICCSPAGDLFKHPNLSHLSITMLYFFQHHILIFPSFLM